MMELSESTNVPPAASNLILSFLADCLPAEKGEEGGDDSEKDVRECSAPSSYRHLDGNRRTQMQIDGWKPSTTLALLYPNRSVEACDIIDHSFGRMFLQSLRAEIHSTNILSKLKPSRTAMDHQIDDLMKQLAPLASSSYGSRLDISSTMRDYSGATSYVNSSISTNVGATTRGDLSVIIPRSFRSTEQFKSRYPNFYQLISSIENSAEKHLLVSESEKGLKNEALSCELPHRIELDKSLTSVQLASYPGDGVSGYARHCDTGAVCNAKNANLNARPSVQGKPQRIITAIYYITNDDWSPDDDGGCLRIFGQKEQQEVKGCSHDIVPYADRLVIFRSDLVEHQVLPSLKRDRLAITVWLYGHFITNDKNSDVDKTPSASTLSRSLNRGDDNKDISDEPNAEKSISLSSSCSPLPIYANADPSRWNKTIFVSIPSYRDTETHPTISSLIENAAFPERVSIGVVYQYDTSSHDERNIYEEGEWPIHINWTRANLRSLTMDYKDATGPCYARYLAQSLYRGEDFVLQIDSHMRFRPNWDIYLIGQLAKCSEPSRSVLTTYPPGYYLPNDIPDETRATVLVPWKFDENKMLRQKGRLLKRETTCTRTKNEGTTNDNIPCLLYAGGFNFAMAGVIAECPYEQLHHLFFGEEMNMAVRLYTHGYDLYAPPETVCYHLWSRNHRLTFQGDIGASHDPEGRRSLSTKAASKSREMIRQRLLGIGDGLGKMRTVESFADALQVDFTNGFIHQNAKDVGLDPESFV